MKKENDPKKVRNVFLIFGVLQTLAIGLFIFLVFHGMNIINGQPVIGLDSQIVLSFMVPVFIFKVEYIIFSKL